MKVTFDSIADVFSPAMVDTFDRWVDEHKYEKAAFVKYFSPLAKKFGGKVLSVTGTAAKMNVQVQFNAGAILNISLTSSGKFTAKRA